MDITRRKMAMGLLTLPATMALTGCQSVASNQTSSKRMNKIVSDKLSEELNDESTARILAPYIMEASFNMTPPTRPISEASTLIAFAFGNRPNASGDPNQLAEPGPMNAELARCCAEVWRKKPMPMYVQWEIARHLNTPAYADISSTDIISVEPIIDNGKLVYLSTDGVAADIINKHFNGAPSALKQTAVIGHRDHVKRCIMTCKARQISAFAPQEIKLPVWYDELSDQPWTRRRDLYVLTDITAQLTMMKDANIAQAYPS